MVATLVRTIFAQPDGAQVHAQFNRVIDQLNPQERLNKELRRTDAERVVACGGHAGRDRWPGDYCPVIRWRNST